jgi:hypothetical protein
MQAAEVAGCLAFRLNAGRGRYNQRLVPAGTPDLLLVRPTGGCVWVEVKAVDGELREAQREMHIALEARGQTVVVARSVEDVVEVLR